MNQARWQRIEEILEVALECNAQEDREKFLAAAFAGDEELRREVETLIRANFAAGDFLDAPLSISLETAPTQTQDASAETSRRQIGVYRLEREIGRGGMVAVYLLR